ncbi:hypothetical protein [Micromonospora sp. NBC_01796]|uniref:hypothetical protein n=1 Tax=Micromonospora sp. NBC_01796 TaxID=2975987 RepID=UPI002DDA2C63|nr:hypothetical protein [Micromonospora sp. NBC_01796]WSA82724.1 hypothetical protein OIE47_19900 [Micromonospora sp. NBC_01796]
MPTDRKQLAEQLVRLLDIRLLDPLEILLDGDESVEALRTVVRIRAVTWADRIVAGDDREAVGVIMRVVSTLYPDDGPFDPPLDWWRTPLGRAVSRRVGHPTATAISYAVAGAMLGITRQGVHDLVNRGRLTRHPDGGVVPSSVRDRLLQLDGQTEPARSDGQAEPARSHEQAEPARSDRQDGPAQTEGKADRA